MRAMNVLAAAGVCALAGSAMADTAMIAASRDATLYFSGAGDIANGAGDGFFVGRNSQGNIRRGLIGFDIAASVPAGATITGVTLQLNVASANAPVVDIGLHRVFENWSEGPSDPSNEGQGTTAVAGDTTWIYRVFPTMTWTNPGGSFTGLSSATTAVGDAGLYSWSGAGMISDVQGWLNNPANNFGWAMTGGETANNTAKRFDSRQALPGGVVPVLIVDYTPIPAPGAGGVMMLGGLAAMRRRRA